ncbi:hypothetical protein OPAG_02463 [Rhodococcus opacus PD630]|uniref:DUF6319 family protein n=1 Tax=Rhodococcus TaxID=1827 RepID=UPI00029CC157|nr:MULTISPECIES: DUF6319 family protein [Rhodococcus]KXF51834.1 translation initiation factor [Rhodococcus sp. SC4]AHK28831.1 hypothetical protein Pd630_LPD01602 [Rhodococcus opacus PD630]EHI44116.1 hypothetical protein OPAG_02463 [Rhodococcus opacus PD630]KXX63252.1 translation initiation factor [Rhodococcus sp. LB1]UDG98680.1 translation initiation factor [Rhodococcus opacus PD630]
MPPRRRSGAAAPDHLTAENLETLAAAIAEGKRATVYLREAMPSLGLEAGASAKVISVQGNTLLIRPKGVDDELPFEAEELLMRRIPATKPAPAPAAPATPVVHQEIEPGPSPAPKTPAPKTPAAKTVATPQPAATAVPKPAAAPAKRTSKKVPAGVSVTIHAGADNDWSVTVAHGAKRPGKAVPVSPDAVERAVRELGEETAIEAVESIIVAARNLAAARVDELSRQLEDARKALEALGAVE